MSDPTRISPPPRDEPGAPVGGDARLPLHARIRDDLAARIAAQEWAPGAVIPAEAALARHYATSINTVRRSVEQLVREGLLERRQGSGTYVRRPAFDASLFRWFHFTDQDGRVTVPESRLVRRTVVPAPEDAARGLGLARGDAVLHVLRLRLWAETPVVVEDLYLPLPRFARFKEMPESAIGPLLYPVYEREFGCLVAQVEDELSIASVDGEHASLLQVQPGSAVVIVDRASLAADESVIDLRRARGRADRFRYKLRLR
jgi:GntR family transcriptional regulator